MPDLFAKTLRDQRRGMICWGVGLASLVALMLLYYPAVRDSPELNKFARNLPEGVKALIGGAEDYTSPAGYLNGELFSFMLPLLFLMYAVGLGSRAIAGEEEQKTIDLLLANPVSRTRVLLEKAAAAACGTVLLGIVVLVVLLVGGPAAGMHIGSGRLLAAGTSVVLLGLLFGALALTLSSATGARRSARGIVAALAVAAYFLNALAPLVSSLKPFRKLSPFYWYAGNEPLRHGLSLAHVAPLVALTILLVAAAVLLFNRRDIAV
ncbi:MAG: ABC transporter permease subunit [Acidobacteriota bacterium]|nr:ABC transporter permease subunit [Acidobacteriota bacterium]